MTLRSQVYARNVPSEEVPLTAQQALTFVQRHGVVLQAARGSVPSLVSAIVGGPIRGSWWGHPRAREIYRVTQAIGDNPDVLVCKLVDGKVTYVHRRLWPALFKLARRFPKDRLAKVWDEHTASGKHVARSQPFPQWVPERVRLEADRISVEDAEQT